MPYMHVPNVSRFHSAGRGAAVRVAEISVVAGLKPADGSVAADGRGAGGARALVAADDSAVGVATAAAVEQARGAVVARLEPVEPLPVAALDVPRVAGEH